jgi:excisionase family DNA binding protein
MSTESNLLTIPEAANYLGISARTLRDERYRKRIRAVQITERRVGYRRETLNRYLNEREGAEAAAK